MRRSRHSMASTAPPATAMASSQRRADARATSSDSAA